MLRDWAEAGTPRTTTEAITSTAVSRSPGRKTRVIPRNASDCLMRLEDRLSLTDLEQGPAPRQAVQCRLLEELRTGRQRPIRPSVTSASCRITRIGCPGGHKS